MSENLWNVASQIIQIAGDYELAIFNENGIRVAIATGSTKDDCRMHATAIIEGLQLRAEKLQSATHLMKNLTTESECESN